MAKEIEPCDRFCFQSLLCSAAALPRTGRRDGVRNHRRTDLLPRRQRTIRKNADEASCDRSDQARQAVARANWQQRIRIAASSCANRGELDKAIADQNTAIALGSGLGARARQSRQRLLPYNAARGSARRLRPGDHVVSRARSHRRTYNRALVHHALGENDAARQDLQQAATLAPGNLQSSGGLIATSSLRRGVHGQPT